MKIYNNSVLIRTNTYSKRNEVKQVQYNPTFKSDPGVCIALYIARIVDKQIDNVMTINEFKKGLECLNQENFDSVIEAFDTFDVAIICW